LRIGIFTNTYRPSVNGVVNSIDAFRRGLEAEGHTVFIFGPRVHGHVDEDDFVLRFPAHRLSRYPDYPLPLPLAPRLDHLAAQLGLDLVHTQHPWLLGTWGQRFARRHRLPIVTTIHTQYEMYAHYAAPIPPGLLRPGLRATVRRHCNRCHVVVTPGVAMQRYLADVGVSRPIEVVVNATNLDGFDTANGAGVRQAHGVGPDGLLYLFVGRAAKEKSLEVLIEAFCTVAAELPQAKLMIVGGGPELEFLRAHAGRQSCTDRILLPGPVAYDGMAEYHAAADVFVTPSLTEVQPLSLSEAMCARTPVVGFDAGGINDMVQDGLAGLLADPTEGAGGLARRMLALGRDPQMRASLAAAAHDASLRYHIPRATRRLLEVYAQAQREARRG
jgi:glycosyltransferase involved in cell wall biosynthesis